jgi:hypothetical protein
MSSNNEKFAKDFAKHGLGFIGSMALFNFGKTIKNERKRSSQAISDMQKEVDSFTLPVEWEFVFNEKFVVDAKKTMTTLLETIVLADVTIETELVTTAKKLIESMNSALEKKEKKNNGNQA